MKKCKKCGAPLEGFLYNTIGKLLGLKPSDKDPEVCNKCEAETEEKSEEVKKEEDMVKTEEPKAQAVADSAASESVEDKDELIS